jgi:hypothetical protein
MAKRKKAAKRRSKKRLPPRTKSGKFRKRKTAR